MKCKYCDSEISDKALVCPHCQKTLITKGNKSKALAVILAHLFGTFTWFYTWKMDKGKWVLATLCGVILGIVASGLDSFISRSMVAAGLEPKDGMTGVFSMAVVWFIVYVIGSIWAVILAWSRPREWYWFYFLNVKKRTKK